MGCKEEVVKVAKKLENIVYGVMDQEQALDLLKLLSDLPITLDILQKTKIGKTVNSLRKSTSEHDVITLSKSLIKSWKKLLPDALSNRGDGNSRNRDKSDKSNPNNSSSGTSKHGSSTESPSKSVLAVENMGTSKQTIFLSNGVRLKCREMLSSALKMVEVKEDDFGDPEDLAAKIEDCVYQEFRDTKVKYKNRIRSRMFNLKDSKNPALRVQVLKGIIQPERIAVMTAEEMATEEMKKLRQKFTNEAINYHQMAVTGGTKTDLLKCGKCRKSNCTYNQVQTRRADEPMTTFVFCNECGNKWRF